MKTTNPAAAHTPGPWALLNKSSAALAAEYRSVVAIQRRSPIELQWRFGAELKALKNAFLVVKESEQIRTL